SAPSRRASRRRPGASLPPGRRAPARSGRSWDAATDRALYAATGHWVGGRRMPAAWTGTNRSSRRHSGIAASRNRTPSSSTCLRPMRWRERAAAMSLVGSLEDLGLGDLLQIVHLAGKSGVLRLRGDAGEGQIVFRKGMIREAHAKSGPTD